MPDKETKDEIIEYHAPKVVSLPRPSADSPLVTMKPTISSSLVQQMAATNLNSSNENDANGLSGVPIGTMCKNNGCKQVLLNYIIFKIIQNYFYNYNTVISGL